MRVANILENVSDVAPSMCCAQTFFSRSHECHSW